MAMGNAADTTDSRGDVGDILIISTQTVIFTIRLN
jgi:hypothetical protein